MFKIEGALGERKNNKSDQKNAGNYSKNNRFSSFVFQFFLAQEPA
jgi:hypothetical protein